MTLRRRFVLVLAAFALILAGGFAYLPWRISRDALAAELDRRLTDVAGAVAATGVFQGPMLIDLMPGDEETGGWSGLQASLETMVRQGYVADAFIFDGAPGREYRALVTRHPSDSIPIGTPLPQLRAHQNAINRTFPTGGESGPVARRATGEVFVGEDGRRYKYGFVRLDDSPAVLGVLMPAEFLEPLGRLSRTLLLGSVVALALAVALGGLLAANIVQPLERLSRAALRIQRGRMDGPVEVERGDELGRLSRAMERMRKGILERDEQLRLMLAQVAHEIRNPLGGLELFASAAAETTDPEERSRLMWRVRSEIEALNRIIDDFLVFARPLQTNRHGADLRDAVRAGTELAEDELDRERCELELDLPDEALMAVADQDQVKRAVLNLIHNAAQVATRVRVRAEWSGTQIVVRVTDDGPGVPEPMRDRIFEPFITDKEKGAGLGLAIVRKVAEAHGGRVEVSDAEDPGFGSGAEFRLYFIGLEEPPSEPSHDTPGTPLVVRSGREVQPISGDT